MSQFRIRELRIRNYRAFADARLKLDDVTFLVGRNGAGKSTLLDAFSFVSEALTDSLATALERRGNLEGVRRRQAGRGGKRDVWVSVAFDCRGEAGVYGFRLGMSPSDSSFEVKQEVGAIGLDVIRRRGKHHIVEMGEAKDAQDLGLLIRDGFEGRSGFTFTRTGPDKLFLPLMADANESWAAVMDGFRMVGFHQLDPRRLQAEPNIGGEERLNRSGSNAGDVLKRLGAKDRAWIAEGLGAAVPGIRNVRATARAGRRVVVFDQEAEGGAMNEFDASMMSDGTVRCLGVLLSLRQDPRPSIVLLDEIEDSLHPFAQAVLLDSIEAVASVFPVVVSTHNPEVLSHRSARGDRIRVVEWSMGASQVHHLSARVIAGLDPPTTVGDLLRSNALWTERDPSSIGDEDDFFKVD